MFAATVLCGMCTGIARCLPAGLLAFPIAFVLPALISVGLFPTAVVAKDSQRCGFAGKLDGEPVNKKNSSCEVARAGSQPYLLVSVRAQKGWLFDLSGIRDDGMATLRLKAMGPGGFNGPQSKTYIWQGKAKVLRYKKRPTARIVKLDVVARTADGSSAKSVQGLFVWTVASEPDSVSGELRIQAGDVALARPGAKIGKWSSGHRISQLFLVRPGETMTFSMLLPSLAPGEYTQKDKTKAQMMHMTMKDGKFSAATYSADAAQIKITGSASAPVVHFEADLVDGKGNRMPIKGSFEAK